MKLKRRTVKYLQRKRFDKNMRKLRRLVYVALSRTLKMSGEKKRYEWL